MAIERTLKSVAMLWFTAFLVVLALNPVTSADLWWHLKAGHWIIAHGRVPHVDVFHPLGLHVPWLLTQWLGSVILYLTFKAGGVTALKILRAVIFLASVAISAIYGRKKLPFALLAIILVPLAWGLQGRILLRPLLFNLLFIQIFLIVLFAYLKNGNPRKLIILPLCAIVWFNIHIGCIFYGLLILLIFLLCAGIDVLNNRIARTPSQKALLRFKHLGLTTLFFAAALLIGPYGLAGVLYPFKILLQPSYIHFYKINDLITEMRPPAFILTLSGWWFYPLSLGGLWAVAAKKTDKLVHILLLAVALFFFFYGVRGSTFFCLTTFYLIARTAEERQLRQRWAAWRRGRHVNILTALLVILLTGFLGIRTFNATAVVDGHARRYRMLTYRPPNAVAAVHFLRVNKIKGVIFNDDTLGGYLLWAGYPDIRPIFDGRQLDQHIMENYIHTLYQPAKYWPTIEKAYGISVALLDMSGPAKLKLGPYLNSNPRWQLVFLKSSVVIFIKKGHFHLPAEALQLHNRLSRAKVSPALLARLERYARRKPSPQWPWDTHIVFDGRLNEALSLILLGYTQAGLDRMGVLIREDRIPSLPYLVKNTLEIYREDTSLTTARQ